MNAFWLALLSNALLSHSVTVHREHRDIETKTKIELEPMHILCNANDMIKISAPIVTGRSKYYLNKPNGDVLHLNITSPNKLRSKYNYFRLVKMLVKKKPYVTMGRNYEVFSLNWQEHALQQKEAEMNDNEFFLGPLAEEDHGNWVLSVYNMDYNGDWIEIFQVISIEIMEIVDVDPPDQKLHIGATLHVQFAYPIQGLTSCQLEAPTSTFDRLFERSHLDMDRCHFILRNVTRADSGMWGISAVGRIVYKGVSEVHVTMPKI